jgi:RNA polymerase sigma factor (sigma-70 family)
MEILENLIDILRIQNIRNFNTYLYSVIKNHCLKRLKRASRSGLVFKNPQEMASLAVDNSQNEDLLDKRNVDFEHLLNQLSEAQKYCIERFYFEKKSYRQIADGNGYNLRQVKTHIQNGKKRLRTLIQREAEKT